MKPVRYIVGAIGFLLVWFVVAALIDCMMVMVFPAPSGSRHVMVGIGSDWRNILGTILGLLAGIQSFRASIRDPKKKDDK
jgi:hypothetical protein